ncbi:MAG: ROK family protein [Lachnospiraceae bacterium]
MKKNTTKVLKAANKYLVMQCIQTYEPVTTEEITLRTSLSRPTVLETVKEFLEAGYIVKNGFSESTGGRPAELICINEDSAYAVGIDFEFPKVRMSFANMKKEIIASREMKFHIDSEADLVLTRLLDEIASLIAEAGKPREKIVGIGLGISGTIHKREGKSLHIKRIRGWDYINMKEILEEKFQVPVYMKNDVHLLALIEKEKYLPADTEDFVYIGIRSGIGSAIFYHNRPLDGNNGNAGYIGHTILDVNGPECVCGNRGCLDAFSGELAMNRFYRTQTGQEDLEEYYTLYDFIEKAKAGDADSALILQRAAFYLGIALSNLLKTLEVETVIVGGCGNLEGSVYWETLKKTVRDSLVHDMEMNPDIRPGRLCREEYALGACCYVFEHLFAKPKLSLAVT